MNEYEFSFKIDNKYLVFKLSHKKSVIENLIYFIPVTKSKMPLQDQIIDSKISYPDSKLFEGHSTNDIVNNIQVSRTIQAIEQIKLLSQYANGIFSKISDEVNTITERVTKIKTKVVKLQMNVIDNADQSEAEPLGGNYELLQELLLGPETVPKNLYHRYNAINKIPNYTHVAIAQLNENIDKDHPLYQSMSEINTEDMLKKYSDSSLFLTKWLKEQEKRENRKLNQKARIKNRKKALQEKANEQIVSVKSGKESVVKSVKEAAPILAESDILSNQEVDKNISNLHRESSIRKSKDDTEDAVEYIRQSAIFLGNDGSDDVIKASHNDSFASDFSASGIAKIRVSIVSLSGNPGERGSLVSNRSLRAGSTSGSKSKPRLSLSFRKSTLGSDAVVAEEDEDDIDDEEVADHSDEEEEDAVDEHSTATTSSDKVDNVLISKTEDGQSIIIDKNDEEVIKALDSSDNETSKPDEKLQDMMKKLKMLRAAQANNYAPAPISQPKESAALDRESSLSSSRDDDGPAVAPQQSRRASNATLDALASARATRKNSLTRMEPLTVKLEELSSKPPTQHPPPSNQDGTDGVTEVAKPKLNFSASDLMKQIESTATPPPAPLALSRPSSGRIDLNPAPSINPTVAPVKNKNVAQNRLLTQIVSGQSALRKVDTPSQQKKQVQPTSFGGIGKHRALYAKYLFLFSKYLFLLIDTANSSVAEILNRRAKMEDDEKSDSDASDEDW